MVEQNEDSCIHDYRDSLGITVGEDSISAYFTKVNKETNESSPCF